jgi:hypothetical protein
MKLIYVLRAQCKSCNLDKMITFYRVPNATPTAMYDGNEGLLRSRFKRKYKCKHSRDIIFTREIDKLYKWDEKRKVPVRR